MQTQANNSVLNRSSANPTVATAAAPTQGALAMITLGVRNFIDSFFPQHTVPTPAQPVQASSPQIQAKPALPALASEQLRPALRLDNWQALQHARWDHPGLADDDKSLMWHAVEAGAFHIAFTLQGRGVDPFGPDAGTSVFYAALQNGKYYVAEQMLWLNVRGTGGEFPDLAPCLELALDKKDQAAINWLINCLSGNNVQLLCDALQNAIKNNNRDRIHLLSGDASVAYRLKPLPGMGLKFVCAAWLSTVSEKSGQTALHLAVASGDPGLVSTLLDCGVDVNQTNSANQTPLALALDKGLFGLTTQLLERRVQPIRSAFSSLADEVLSNQGHATVANAPIFVENGSNAIAQSSARSQRDYQIPTLLPSILENDLSSTAGKAVPINHGTDKVTALKKKEWVQFTEMVFKNKGKIILDIQHSAHLQSFMEWMQVAMFPVKSLEIVDKICVNDVQELAKILEFNTTVTTVILTRTAIGSNGAQELAKMLKNNTTITTIDLNSNGIGADGIQALAEMLKINSTITTLSLCEHKLRADDIQALINVLETNTSVKTVKLNGIGSNDDVALALAKMLKTNTTITTINLKYCSIGDIGARALAEMLSTNNTVRAINLVCNQFGSNGIQALAEMLKKNTTITTINLSDNSFGADGVLAFGDMFNANTSLMRINLSGNSIGAHGARVLAEMLKTNTSITSVNLSQNYIRADGARVLAEMLKTNTSLTSINLRENYIGADGVRSLAEALKDNTTITAVDLHHTGIGDDGARVLAEMLKTNRTITSIKLSDKGIGIPGWRALCEMLETNSSITEFETFSDEIYDVAMKSEVLDVLRHKKMLPLIEKAALSANEMLNHQTPSAMQADLPILPLDVSRLITQGIADNLPVNEAKRVLRALKLDL